MYFYITVYLSITAMVAHWISVPVLCFNVATLNWNERNIRVSGSSQTNNSLYSQTQIQVGFNKCLLHAAVQLCLLSHVATINSLVHTAPRFVKSIFIQKSCGSQRGLDWVVCGLEIGKAGLWLEGHKFESQYRLGRSWYWKLQQLSVKYGSLVTSSGSCWELRQRIFVVGRPPSLSLSLSLNSLSSLYCLCPVGMENQLASSH